MKRIYKKVFITIFFIFAVFGLYGKEKDEIVMCTTDYLNIREEPGMNKKILKVITGRGEHKLQLRITQTVKVIKRTEKEEIVSGKKGRWAYIDPGYSDKTCGWVFDYYLAKKEDFSPLKSLQYDYILKFADGDAPYKFEFFKDGTFIFKANREGEKDKKGKLYIDNRNKVITIKYDKSDDFQLYMMMISFFWDDNKICVIGGGDPCAVIKK